MTQRLIAFALIVMVALIALSASEHRAANAGVPLVNVDYRSPQCTPPTLDYSHRMVRLDGKSIA